MDFLSNAEAPVHKSHGGAFHDLNRSQSLFSCTEEEAAPIDIVNNPRSRSPSPSLSPSSSPSGSTSPPPSSSSPSVHRALLDKPLEELTEEDIMQLTREDCRRYLKEKGMRRPSWNKSQAIQQVLSLKGLFDDCKDENENGPKKLSKESAVNPKSATMHDKRLMSTSPQVDGMGQETCVNSSRILENHGHSNDQNFYYQSTSSGVSQASGRLPRNLHANTHSHDKTVGVTGEQYEKNHVYPGNTCAECATLFTRHPSPQLTIFYSGLVNVYDNIPADKAQAIMLLAASGHCLKHTPCLHNVSKDKMIFNAPFAANDSSVCDFQSSKLLYNPLTIPSQTASLTSPSSSVSLSISQGLRATISSEQPPPSREASVQRYLEKRRERGEFTYLPSLYSRKSS